MREHVQSLHARFECLQNRTPIDFQGEHYRFAKMKNFVKPQPIEHPQISIHLAAVLRDLCDGLADPLILTIPEGPADVVARIAADLRGE